MIASTAAIAGGSFLLPRLKRGRQTLRENKNHMKDKLNHSQWNSLRITVSTFEKNLRRAQAWLDGMEKLGHFMNANSIFLQNEKIRLERL